MDCNYHENKMVGKSVLYNKGRVISQREIRLVWNNAQRVNHQNKLTHLHPKRNFIPTTVLTKSGQVPVNAAKQSFPRAVASISTARPVNTATPKLKVNDALPITYSYFKAHSPVRMPFNQNLAAKTNNFKEKVNTVRFNDVTTAGPKAVVNVADGSYTPKRFDYVDPQGRLKCSRHMTGNKFYLLDYQEIDGGFVGFGKSPKGGGLTCLFAKATIDESNLWHRRLGLINFKTMNKLNRVLITKPHNKTPYELLVGRPPNLDFMRPFECLVTILNTLDHLGKFEGKADEGFLVGYCWIVLLNRSKPSACKEFAPLDNSKATILKHWVNTIDYAESNQ
ncbi:ribonuclease H-like domain-containing protein [Tanacetum coccineum]